MIVGHIFKVEICLQFIYILRELSLKYHSEYIPINGIPSLDSDIKIFLDPSMFLVVLNFSSWETKDFQGVESCCQGDFLWGFIQVSCNHLDGNRQGARFIPLKWGIKIRLYEMLYGPTHLITLRLISWCLPGKCSIVGGRSLISPSDNLWYVGEACLLECWDTWMGRRSPPRACPRESLRPQGSSWPHSPTCLSIDSQSAQCNNPTVNISPPVLSSQWSSGSHKGATCKMEFKFWQIFMTATCLQISPVYWPFVGVRLSHAETEVCPGRRPERLASQTLQSGSQEVRSYGWSRDHILRWRHIQNSGRPLWSPDMCHRPRTWRRVDGYLKKKDRYS